jgi:hypothetical protein
MLTPEQEAIKTDRRKIYGEPLENHQGIAQMWAPLLQPHAEAIAAGRPIPAWAVALLMAALKLDRMRLIYHEDNYADIAVYLSFAKEWQKNTVLDVCATVAGMSIMKKMSESAKDGDVRIEGFCALCGASVADCFCSKPEKYEDTHYSEAS